MDTRIADSLHRQMKGFELLKSLLEEEFDLLRGKNSQLVTQIEFSIQELMHQLMIERSLLVKKLQGKRLRQYIAAFPDTPQAHEDAALLDALIDVIDRLEQDCARLAENNKVLVLALMDQSQALVDYLYKQVVPKEKGAYSPHGKYASRRPEAALIKGKF